MEAFALVKSVADTWLLNSEAGIFRDGSSGNPVDHKCVAAWHDVGDGVANGYVCSDSLDGYVPSMLVEFVRPSKASYKIDFLDSFYTGSQTYYQMRITLKK